MIGVAGACLTIGPRAFLQTPHFSFGSLSLHSFVHGNMIFNHRHGFLAAGLAALAPELAAGATTLSPGSTSSCRVLPGDADWPTLQDWQDLNKTVGGRLIEIVPRESVCHDAPYNRYDAEACAELQETFDFPTLARYETTLPLLHRH